MGGGGICYLSPNEGERYCERRAYSLGSAGGSGTNLEKGLLTEEDREWKGTLPAAKESRPIKKTEGSQAPVQKEQGKKIHD